MYMPPCFPFVGGSRARSGPETAPYSRFTVGRHPGPSHCAHLSTLMSERGPERGRTGSPEGALPVSLLVSNSRPWVCYSVLCPKESLPGWGYSLFYTRKRPPRVGYSLFYVQKGASQEGLFPVLCSEESLLPTLVCPPGIPCSYHPGLCTGLPPTPCVHPLDMTEHEPLLRTRR